MNRYLMKTLFILAVFLSSGCQNTKSKPEVDLIERPKGALVKKIDGTKGGTLALDLPGNPQTFNPLLSLDKNSQTVWDKVFLGLVTYNLETLQYEPDLAASYEISKDGLTYTFVIREGLKWSDGSAFKVEDILFTYEVLQNVPVVQSRFSLIETKQSYPTLTKIDDLTIQFKLNETNALFLAAIGEMRIIPEHKYGAHYRQGEFLQVLSTGTAAKDIVGTGPFLIETYVPDQRIVYKRNPYYFGFDDKGQRLPYFEKLVRIIIPDANARYLTFENGETDMIDLEVENFDRLKKKEKNGGFKVFDLGPSLLTNYFSCLQNPEKRADDSLIMEPWKYKLFSDRRFRQAVSYAADREGMVNTVFHGRGREFSSFSSPGNKTWYPSHYKTYRHDPELAKALLKQIGLKDTDKDGYLEYQAGSKISFSIHTNSEDPKRIQLGNLLIQDLKKVGLEVQLKPMPLNSLIELTDNTLNYDCYILGWAPSTPPDPVLSKNILLSSGALHDWYARQKTPHTPWEAEIDKYMQLNQTTIDEKKRLEYWHQVEKIWHEEQPQINLVVPHKFVAIKNHVGNAKPSSYRPYHEWNLEDLFDVRLKSTLTLEDK